MDGEERRVEFTTKAPRHEGRKERGDLIGAIFLGVVSAKIRDKEKGDCHGEDWCDSFGLRV